MLSHTDMLLRIAVSAALGAVIGYERDRHGRPVGLRTHFIVALASATFMTVSSQFAYHQGFELADGVEVDASRIAASVVSAVGFLAGGAILRDGATIQGLTTASGLWLVTAIGLCGGAGMFPEALFATALGIFALTVLRRFEDKDDSKLCRVSLSAVEEGSLSGLQAALAGLAMTPLDLEYERRLGSPQGLSIGFNVRVPPSVSLELLVQTLERATGAQSLHVRPR